MTDLQSLPVPSIPWSRLSRDGIAEWFTAVQFRAWGLLYLVYAVVLAAGWVRSRARESRFEPVLLLTVVVWGGVYFARTLGRSDRDHLESALPPVCLLLAHAMWLAWRRATRGLSLSPVTRRGALAGVCVAVLAGWLFLSGAPDALRPDRALVPLRAAEGAILMDRPAWARSIDARVDALRETAGPGEEVLDLSFSPLLYVLSGRLGPGWHDTVMPGTFLDASEEAAFVARLDRAPPAAVVWPVTRFDDRDDRTAAATAPRLLEWVARRYELVDGPRLAVARRKP